MIESVYNKMSVLKKEFNDNPQIVKKEEWTEVFLLALECREEIFESDENLSKMGEILGRSIAFVSPEVMESSKAFRKWLSCILLLDHNSSFLNSGRTRMDFLACLLPFICYKTSAEEVKKSFTMFSGVIKRVNNAFIEDLRFKTR